MNAPTVSVMMPAYNAAEFIGAAIDSVLAQTFEDWELVVVDDGSKDETAQIVRGYTDRRIRLIQQANAGEAAARNAALDHAQGELLAFLDADDEFLPQHLTETVKCLQGNLQIDAVYTDGNHTDTRGNVLQSLSSRRRGPFTGSLFEQLVLASDVFGPPVCVVLRRQRVETLGIRFDPRIVIGPDWDFFTRFAEHTRFAYLDQRTCLYRIHQTNISLVTGLQRRRGYLALCREKAIHLDGFAACSLETRRFVFYDLLVNLLTGRPEKQRQVLGWPQFLALPAGVRSSLLRQMGLRSLAIDPAEHALASEWLAQAIRTRPADLRNLFWGGLHGMLPAAAQRIARQRSDWQESDVLGGLDRLGSEETQQ